MKKLSMTKILKKRGGESMKKLNNNKGFSLIELLIVIAIMGVLAVIAFNMFSGVLGNSKKRADEQQANQIKKAVEILMTDSGKTDLSGLTFYNESGTAITVGDGTNSDQLILALQSVIKLTADTTKEFGPLLAPKAGASPSASNYAPQYDTIVGGPNGYIGYTIDIYPASNTCKVKPTTTDPKIHVHTGM